MTEKEMRPIVVRWLFDRGYYPLHEILVGHYVDLIGVQFQPRVGRKIPPLQDVIAVELKIKDYRGVLSQTRNCQHFVSQAYAALPSDQCGRMTPKVLDRFGQHGVGVLAVDSAVSLVMPARFCPKEWKHINKRYWATALRQRHRTCPLLNKLNEPTGKDT